VRASPPDLKTISKFAQLEYRLGEPERGKTLFEGIVDSHPKRWDLWSIYIDMEVGQNDIQSMRLGYSSTAFFSLLVLTDHHHLRNLFDRILAQKMTSHKAKYVFYIQSLSDCPF
jgi:rRNA biogenesis protein RRP5